jgi:monoamine oxidase
VGGNQNLTEAIADAIGRENITLNAQVTNVIDTEEGVEVRAVDTSDFKNHTFKGKYCVLTMPLYRLFEVQFEPRLSDDVYKAVHSQGWGAYFTAHCILKKEAEKFWTVDGVSILPLLHGGPLGVIYPGKSPADGEKIMVNLLVTGGAAEQYNSRMRSFDDVQKMIEKGFEESYPGITPMIERWTFYRYHPRAIASWPVKRSRFDELSEVMRKAHGRLYFAGDFTESTHSDGAMKSAYRVSRLIKERAGIGSKN